MAYNYTITLQPWGPDHGQVQVDPAALYGYWEHKDGSEGGGLWFGIAPNGAITLEDYDGAFALPRAVIDSLSAAGFTIEE